MRDVGFQQCVAENFPSVLKIMACQSAKCNSDTGFDIKCQHATNCSNVQQKVTVLYTYISKTTLK